MYANTLQSGADSSSVSQSCSNLPINANSTYLSRSIQRQFSNLTPFCHPWKSYFQPTTQCHSANAVPIPQSHFNAQFQHRYIDTTLSIFLSDANVPIRQFKGNSPILYWTSIRQAFHNINQKPTPKMDRHRIAKGIPEPWTITCQFQAITGSHLSESTPANQMPIHVNRTSIFHKNKTLSIVQSCQS